MLEARERMLASAAKVFDWHHSTKNSVSIRMFSSL